jgi:HTH-type transcriptional regulator / antitoxin HigA
MKPTPSTKTFDQLPTTYADLVAWHMPRPIRDKAEYENAVEIIDQLAGHDLNPDQDDFLDLLSDLVSAYEDEHVKPLRRIRGIDALRYILKENSQTGDDLAAMLKIERSVAYRILKGTRNLTADHIRILAKRFHVSGDLFLA